MSELRKKIVLVAGARPNFMKVAPIIRELRKHEDVFDWKLVHTGQHYDHGMSDVFFQELGIPEPHYHMGAGGGSHAEQTARIMIAFEKYCHELKPDMVVVVGDVNSTLACSIVAKKLSIAVAHVEAGLRSRDMTMPEEVNRIVTDSISDVFFVTEPSGAENLVQEGHDPKRIHFVGHVMIDNLYFQMECLRSADTSRFQTNRLKQSLGAYGVLTLHRPSNVDDKQSLSEIMGALSSVSASLPLIFPVHPRTSANLQAFGISLPQSIYCTEPLPYMEFLNLWSGASVVFTDSGGLQEETTALGIPCVTLRSNTERPVTVSEGTNILAGTSANGVQKAFLQALQHRVEGNKRLPKFWDGESSGRIINVLKGMFDSRVAIE